MCVWKFTMIEYKDTSLFKRDVPYKQNCGHVLQKQGPLTHAHLLKNCVSFVSLY